ncbi:MAG: hypothetical protein DI526_18775 [Caulobacter segnis]|uniref:Uncharacterized protein n=1 Tax=Caulobacter segnis TaxID=88688 RepID=A0A2W5WDP6_9CAUL|nr:MAG: hypothetical protein DI526_18775 [Caulobacter segnis]
MQSTRGGHRELGDLTDHAGQTAILQTLFHGPQDRRLIAGLGEDHTLGRQTRLRQRRGEKIALSKTPEHGAIRPREDPGREACCGGAMQRPLGPAGDLMQRAHRQTLTG